MANAQYGYFYDSPTDYDIVYYPHPDTRVIGPYDTFTDAKKALMECVYKEREVFDKVISHVKTMTKRELADNLNEIDYAD